MEEETMIIHPRPQEIFAGQPIEVQVFTHEEALMLGWVIDQFRYGVDHPIPRRHQHPVQHVAKIIFTHFVLLHTKKSFAFHYAFVEASKKDLQPNTDGIPLVVVNLHQKVGRALKRELTVIEMSPDGMQQQWI